MSTRRSSCSGVPLQGTRLWFKGRESFQGKSCSMQQDDALIAELTHSHRPAVSAEVITMFMAMIFADRRLISTDRLHDCRIPWVGLAGSGWTNHLSPGATPYCRMARHWTLGDRPFYRHQFCLRPRLDRACARPAWALTSLTPSPLPPLGEQRCGRRRVDDRPLSYLL